MRIFSVLGTVVTLTLAGAAAATPLTIGNGTAGNAFPFGGTAFDNPTTYQQVYNASAFGASPLSISGISFTLESGSLSGGTYTLSLSTTGKPVNGLDTSNFASNVGADDTQVFSGALAGQLTGSTLGFTFAPFTYDPAAGNLLLNVSVSGVSGIGGFFLSNSGDAGGAFSRAHDFGSGFSDFGLVTTFEVGPGVPEAATWLMMISGFGLVGVSLRSRQAAAAA